MDSFFAMAPALCCLRAPSGGHRSWGVKTLCGPKQCQAGIGAKRTCKKFPHSSGDTLRPVPHCLQRSQWGQARVTQWPLPSLLPSLASFPSLWHLLPPLRASRITFQTHFLDYWILPRIRVVDSIISSDNLKEIWQMAENEIKVIRDEPALMPKEADWLDQRKE